MLRTDQSQLVRRKVSRIYTFSRNLMEPLIMLVHDPTQPKTLRVRTLRMLYRNVSLTTLLQACKAQARGTAALNQTNAVIKFTEA